MIRTFLSTCNNGMQISYAKWIYYDYFKTFGESCIRKAQ